MAKKQVSKNRGTGKPSLDSSPGLYIPFRWLVPALGAAVILMLVIGIGSAANPPAAPSATKKPTRAADPCSIEQVRPDVEKVHALMLEFYDASALASQTPAEQLLTVIPTLQEIRRRAEALKVSSCLDVLRSYQVSHMNMVINTLLAFMAKSDQSILMEGIVQARLLNEEYKKEKARLLGETYLPPVTRTPLPTLGTAAGTGTGTVTALGSETPTLTPMP
ncbi:MAG: hypothetical protein JW929_12380 [Anaerolineales bacterium]|nr:hypothetical protein [Anaerolineales bacterium]